jgi:hypothetical protein
LVAAAAVVEQLTALAALVAVVLTRLEQQIPAVAAVQTQRVLVMLAVQDWF